MKTFYLLLIAVALSITACRTKDGQPGPAGESSLTKQGSISGTITYTDVNGNNATAPFSYQYFESLEENKFYWYDEEGEYYGLDFSRRDLKDAQNYFSITIGGESINGLEQDPYFNYINFSFVTVINNELHEFSRYGRNSFEITNVSLDPTTGRLIFDFTGTVDSDEGEATVTGKVDVVLNRTRSYIGDNS